MDDVDAFTPGRTVDIDLGTAEVITIDLDNLDPNPDDVLDLLKDGQCKDWVWTKLAGEYWRKGYLDGAERIALTAIECEPPQSGLSSSQTDPWRSFPVEWLYGFSSTNTLPPSQYHNRSLEGCTKTHSG